MDQLDLAERVALLADGAGADAVAESVRRAARRARAPLGRVAVMGGSRVGKSRLVAVLGEGGWAELAGLELVDTPDWETWPDHPETAALARLVADCDLLVVATEARRALPSTEQARLRALAAQPQTPPLLVLVTKLDEVEDEAPEVLLRVRHLTRTLAPAAQVLPAPQQPPVDDQLAQARAVLAALAGPRDRIARRTVRRHHQLADVCRLIAQAAERALAEAERAEPVRRQALQLWRAQREIARVRWLTLAADLDKRCQALLNLLRDEVERRRVACAAELAGALAEGPDARAFIRLVAVPRVEERLQELQDSIGETVREALSRDADWLGATLLADRPGESGAPELAGASPVPDLERGHALDSRAAQHPDGWDLSRLPDLLGSAIETLLAPHVSDAVAHLAGSAGTALTGSAVSLGNDQRLERVIDDLEHVVRSTFAARLASTEERVRLAYQQLADRAHRRDEQWWQLNTAALSAPPESVQHWQGLAGHAATLGALVDARLATLEGA
ncbi:hypothetical protein C7C46_21475 [Streptomyces tateyamensis]|uniref:Uncharacterized protein n=1 Tax=Streptomyces tateyamensis TaxID=565073 RepID=A0A2V4NM89_9ACTN|nr:GTPase domain-containing protein [Streptomyces tateyamensis]PYC76758.1 hypothetical protein C7C46_21475 [Streptomyces tateyamensis]